LFLVTPPFTCPSSSQLFSSVPYSTSQDNQCCPSVWWV
jgi:hypothetical protein